MSIASRITSIENHIEEAYTEISRLGVDLTNVDKNIDNIADMLQEAYENTPKVTGEGSSLSLTPTRKGGLSIIPKGACEQDVYSGKQLIDRTTCLENKGLKWVDGDVVSNTNNLLTDYIEVEINQNYTNNYIGAIFFFNSNKDYLGAYQVDGSLAKVGSDFRGNTFLVPNNNDIKYVRIVFRGDWNDNINILTVNVQTEKGSTITSWEPYVGGLPSPSPDFPQSVRVVTGDNEFLVSNKNLVDYSKFFNTSATIISYNTNDIVVRYTNVYQAIRIDIPLKNNNYYLSIGSISITGARIEINLYKNGVKIGSTQTTTTTYSINNTNGDYDEVRLLLSNGNISGTNDITFSNIQLEIGNSGTAYVQGKSQSITLHLGDIKLNGIGDYIDLPFKDGDIWKIRRKVEKKIYSGTSDENWIYEQNNNGFLILNTLTNLKDLTDYDATKIPDFICNQYIPVSYNSYTGGSIGISERYFNNTDFLRVKSSLTDVSAFKTYLSNNNILLYYPIATPVEIPITDTTLITDLNNMYKAMGYNGTTNITITSNPSNAQMLAQVSALKGE